MLAVEHVELIDPLWVYYLALERMPSRTPRARTSWQAVCRSYAHTVLVVEPCVLFSL